MEEIYQYLLCSIWRDRMNLRNTKELRRKLRAAVAMLLVSTLLLANSSYAWLVLATAPEVSGVTSVIGANGNLEIALATTEHLRQLQENDMYEPEDAEFVMANGNAVHDNVLWGNLVDVMSTDYGLYALDMRPALLNVVDGAVARIPVSLASYGNDGRMETFDAENFNLDQIGMSAVYNTEKSEPVAGTLTMDRASLEAGLIDKEAVLQDLLANVQYGVRLAGPLTYNGAYNPESENVTVDLVVDGYCFALDLLVRTNAPVANLMLQTEGALRVETDDAYLAEEYQGQGSFIDLNNPLMTAALNVVFADTLTGQLYAVAQPNPEDGKLWITFRADENGELIPTAPEDSAKILPLTQNRVTALTAWVYINGHLVDNASAMTQSAIELLMNLQFSTDAVLNPAYTDNDTDPVFPDRPELTVPTIPNLPGETVDPSVPSTPTTPTNPSEPIEAGTFYLENKENGSYSIYALDDNGSRTYDTEVAAAVNGSAVTVNSVQNCAGTGIVIPAVVEDAQSGAKYDVKLNPSAFADVKTKAVPVHVLEVDGKKVEPTGTSLYEMFRDGAYTSIDLRGLDTSHVTTMSQMFYDCSSLTNLDVSAWDTDNVTDMSWMFSGCSNLTILDVRGFDTGNVSSMLGMFNRCSGLTSLDVSGFDTSSVTTMYNMFGGCSGLTSLDVSGFDTGNVATMMSMFASCSSLTRLDLSGFDTGNVIGVYYMFYGCNSLAELDISSWDMSSIGKDSHNMFSFCDSLVKIVSPKTMGTSSVNLPDSYRCAANGSVYTVLDQSVPAKAVLTKVNGDEPVSTDTYYLEAGNNGSYSIYRLNSDGSRAVDTEVTAAVNGSAVTVNSVQNCADSGIVIPAVVEDAQSGATYTVKLDPKAFENVKEKAVPVSVMEVDGKKVEPTGTSLYEMFKNSAYTSIDLRGLDTSRVTYMGSMFYGCSSLTSLDLSGFDTGNVTNMAHMFTGCSSLTSLDVSGFDTGNVTSMGYMFRDCSSLTSLDVSGLDTGKVTDMSYMFSGCTGLKTMNLQNFNTSNVTDMRYMFNNCKNVQSWHLVNLDTSKVTNMSHTFYNCTYLATDTSFYFNTSNVTDMSYMFYGCALTVGGDLDLTNIDVSKATDMRYMFANTCPLGGTLDISNWDLSDVNTTGMFSGCGATVLRAA